MAVHITFQLLEVFVNFGLSSFRNCCLGFIGSVINGRDPLPRGIGQTISWAAAVVYSTRNPNTTTRKKIAEAITSNFRRQNSRSVWVYFSRLFVNYLRCRNSFGITGKNKILSTVRIRPHRKISDTAFTKLSGFEMKQSLENILATKWVTLATLKRGRNYREQFEEITEK